MCMKLRQHEHNLCYPHQLYHCATKYDGDSGAVNHDALLEENESLIMQQRIDESTTSTAAQKHDHELATWYPPIGPIVLKLDRPTKTSITFNRPCKKSKEAVRWRIKLL